MQKYLLLCLLFCVPFLSIGQVTIQGIIKDEQGIAVHDAIIMIVKNGGESIFHFTNSDAQGHYGIQYNSKDDSLYLKVSRLDYASQLVSIANRSQQLDFTLKQQATKLKEVTIHSGVWRNRDTVNYSVSSYAEQNDRTISDILRKMPGIEVRPSGAILYNDEPINKFYVEGLDMMGGRYSVVSENLRHESVRTVQILENHEPIRALEDVSLSDRAALNIVLKEDSRATWQSAMKLGLGATPLLWDEELTLMRFAKSNQDAIVYKTNNTGVNADRELTAHYGIMSSSTSNGLLNIPLPSSPVGENRSLFNNQHVVSVNRLVKLNEVYQLRLNADYLNDRHERNSSSHMVYFLDGTEVVTEEQTNSVRNMNRSSLTLTLTGNEKKYFLENALNVQGDWSNTLADISGTQQRLKNPNFSISDDFRWLKVRGKNRIDIQSDSKLSSTPQSLTVKPGLFAEVFNDSMPYEQLKQEAEGWQFISYSAVSFSTSKGRWQTNYDLGIDLNVQHLSSDLSVSGQTAVDSLCNAFSFLLARPFAAARYSYIIGRLTATLGLPVGYAIQQSQDRLNNISNQENKPYLNPSLDVRYKMGYQWEISTNARYNNNFSTIRSLYTGYLLSDYRSLSKNNGAFSGSNSQSYNLRLSYNEPLKSINASISTGYGRTRFDMLPEVDFNGILSIQNLIACKGYNDSKNLGFNVSKGIGSFITKANLYGTYFISTSRQQQRGIQVTAESKGYRIYFSLDGRISSFANYIYSVSYSSSKSNIEGSTTANLEAIRQTTQNLRVHIFPAKALVMSTIISYNQGVATHNLPSTFFMDLQAQYKFKRWEFSVSWANIFNANQYVIADYSDFFSAVHTFELRPTNVVVSVRFSL